MTTFLILLCVAGLVVLGFTMLSRRDAEEHHSSLVPPPGHATVADVERLVQAGHQIDAIRCYREIHHCDLAEAKQAVDQLSRNRIKH